MSITFDKDKRLFHLRGRDTSLYVYLHESGMPLCPYFGRYLSELDVAAALSASPDWYSTYYSRADGCERSYENLWLNSTQFLTPTHAADARPAMAAVEGFYDDKLDLRYVSHRIYDGKPTSEILPYVRDCGGAQTLELTLKDFYKSVCVKLSLTVMPECNAVLRNTVLINETGAPLWLTRAMSVVCDLPRADMDIVHFPGEWCFERRLRRERLTEGVKIIGSASGRSSHEHNPFVMLADGDATETTGEVYAFSLMYSGSFKCEACVGKTGVTRLTMGIDDGRFRYEVRSGESFVFPEGVTTYGARGFESVSADLHYLIRNNIIKDNNVGAYRSILVNSWEGCYMDYDTEKVVSLVRSAAKLGAETFVLDDGWFANRNDDTRALGDWYENADKADIARIIDECRAHNMRFGLWIEPEMANPDSELLRAHPEYAAVNLDTDFWLSRHQVPLNFADDEVVNAVYERIAAVLEKYDIEYVKWDHNRQLEDCRARNLDGAHQYEFYHRNTLGYYRLAKMLTQRFDNVHFQGCASGGGRFDLGTLFYFPEIWTSDENDPVQRLFIQYGTSFGYPPSVMGAHVNACGVTDIKTKAAVALFGSYGFELDPRTLSEREAAEIREINEIYRKYHAEVVLDGDLHRLISPFDGKAFAVNMVSKDKTKALFLYVNLLKQLRARRFVKLRGLKPDAYYINSLDGKKHKGEHYMNVGLNLSFDLSEFESRLVTLNEV